MSAQDAGWIGQYIQGVIEVLPYDEQTIKQRHVCVKANEATHFARGTGVKQGRDLLIIKGKTLKTTGCQQSLLTYERAFLILFQCLTWTMNCNP
jgi:hypothetical protein